MDIGRKLAEPLRKKSVQGMVKKEMKKGKISLLYDNEIFALLENQPMGYFQTAADFMLLKDTLYRPARHIAPSIMALVLDGYVKKMRLVEADLNPEYPELIEDKIDPDLKGRFYLEVVFWGDEEIPEDLELLNIGAKKYIEELRTDHWYIIDVGLGLIFDKALYMKLERPHIKSILSGKPLRGIIKNTREQIETPDQKAKNVLTVMRGLEQMYKLCPKYKYRNLLFRRMIKLQETYFQKLVYEHSN